MQTYPSTVAQMSWAELHFFKMLFNFGSDSFCTSSGCIGIGEVVHRDSCKWALVPLERAGDDEEDSGPPPPEDSSALPNPDEEDNTTCRCWEHRSELCRLSPSSDIFALRIYRMAGLLNDSNSKMEMDMSVLDRGWIRNHVGIGGAALRGS